MQYNISECVVKCYEYNSVNNNSIQKPEFHFPNNNSIQMFIFNPTDNEYNDYNIIYYKIEKRICGLFRNKPQFRDSQEFKINNYPNFLVYMKNEMESKIDAIIDLLGIGSGILILFNIDGIPKFCTTNTSVLSDEV